MPASCFLASVPVLFLDFAHDGLMLLAEAISELHGRRLFRQTVEGAALGLKFPGGVAIWVSTKCFFLTI